MIRTILSSIGDLAFFVIAVSVVLGVISLPIYGTYKANTMEVSSEQYKTLKKWVDAYPEFKQHVDVALEDDKVSVYEYQRLLKKGWAIEQTRNKELLR